WTVGVGQCDLGSNGGSQSVGHRVTRRLLADQRGQFLVVAVHVNAPGWMATALRAACPGPGTVATSPCRRARRRSWRSPHTPGLRTRAARSLLAAAGTMPG